MQHEPEAVAVDVQRQQTQAADERTKERQRIVWRASRARLRAELDFLRDQPFSRTIQSDLRVLERWIARLDARLH